MIQCTMEKWQILLTFLVDIFCNSPVNKYMLKVNNRNTRKKCDLFPKLTKKTLERHHWRRSGVFFVNFEHILHLSLMFLFLMFANSAWISKTGLFLQRLSIKKFWKSYYSLSSYYYSYQSANRIVPHFVWHFIVWLRIPWIIAYLLLL